MMNDFNLAWGIKSMKLLTINNIKEYIDLDNISTSIKVRREKKKTTYYNIAMSFDIETTSFYERDEKTALMYHWQFAINEYVITGRRWEEFQELLEVLHNLFKTDINNRIVIYVHNLPFEFQFMKHYIKWSDDQLLGNNRDIYYIVTESGIEFRDSLKLSGMSLAKTAENLQTHTIRKMKGDLDYTLLRSPITPLTEKELQYCYNDVLILTAYIQEQLQQHHGNIAEIPLTKTGEVRKYCREFIFNQDKELAKKYRDLISHLRISGVQEYHQLRRAFQGGFTHANWTKINYVEKNVASYDFTSSYPYVMLSEKFPMGEGRTIQPSSLELFEKYMNSSYGCLVDVEFTNIEQRWDLEENILSMSRCQNTEKVTDNNGRVVYAKKLATTITNVDYKMLKKFYTWESMAYKRFRIYPMNYLPTSFVKAILKLYKDKTTLKGVEEKQVEYQVSKGMLNSCYGMSVTDIVKDKYTYNESTGEFDLEKPDYQKSLDEYNKDKSRFLFYPWGVWITAYARRNLFTAILETGHDYCYSDTDSIKLEHHEKYKYYFDNYNKEVEEKLKMAATYHNIPFEDFKPKTIKGKEKMLGVWDFECIYDEFKTLGAKRYFVRIGDKYEITCAGVNKNYGRDFLLEHKNPFEAFQDNLVIPAEKSGKLSHIYVDDEREGIITDYQGNEYEYYSPSGLFLEPSPYHLSISERLWEYILTGGFNGGYNQEE